MKHFTYKVALENGLHARPAGALATEARKFKSSIKIKSSEKEIDAKRLLSVMSLGATNGTELYFEIEGEDESSACEALKAFYESGFGGIR
jgi:phosphocarrier protein